MYHSLRKTATAIALVLPLFAASGASATDLLGDTGDPHVNEQLRQEIRWSGFYAGIAGTIGMTNTDQTVEGFSPEGDFLRSEMVDGFGAEGGGITGTLGYDQRLGRFVIGVFGDFTYSDDFWTTEWKDTDGDGDIRSGEYNRQYDWTAGVRLGKLINPNTMIYGLIGYSQLTGELPAGGVNGGDKPTFDSAQDVTFDGYTVGAGLESKVNDFMSWYVEGRWSQYESESVTFSGGDDQPVYTLEAEPSEVKAMLGLKLRLLTE